MTNNKQQPMNPRINFLTTVNQFLPENCIGVEIGVHCGVFSKMILDVLAPSTLFLIDPWETGFDKNGSTQKYSGRISHMYTAYSHSQNLNHVKKEFFEEVPVSIIVN